MMAMQLQGKVWGRTMQVFGHNSVEVYHLEAKAGGFSSKHVHRHKHNQFFVLSGTLEVTVWQESGLVDTTRLTALQSCVVAPGLAHQFRAITEVVAQEVYWVEIGPDIIRETKGGYDRPE